MAPLDLRGNPYVGPRPYGWRERSRFFGRTRESKWVRDLWEGSRLLILHGPPGSGKSSLLAAGVLPIIDTSNVQLLPIGRISLGAGCVTPDDGIRNVHTYSLLSCWCRDKRPSELRDLTLADYFQALSVTTDAYGDQLTVLAPIDQFEELFTAYPGREADRDDFIDQLDLAMRMSPNLHVLIVLRDEHFADLLAYEDRLPRLELARRRLSPLTPDEARQAITGPLGSTGRFLAPGLVEVFISRLASRSVDDGLGSSLTIPATHIDPIRLQTACATYWTRLEEDLHQIEKVHLPPLSEPHAELQDWYLTAVATVARELDVSCPWLLTWIAGTFLGPHGRPRCAVEGPAATRGMPNAVPAALEREHVLVSERRLGARWYGLGHALLARPAGRAVTAGHGDHFSEWRHLAAAEDAWSQGAAPAAKYQCAQGLKAAAGLATRIDLHGMLGLMAEADEDGAAESHYVEALRLAEQTRDLLRVAGMELALGRLLRRGHQVSQALTRHRRAVELNSRDARALLELGASLLAADKRHEALDAYAAGLHLDPGSYDALVATAEILIDLGRDREAADMTRRAATAAPDPWSTARADGLRQTALQRISGRN
ncbi:tetratricopeptide repeat protein [Microbispora sp. KK1-11]|uniref:nSTAND1 domain-containing NTPase n=1 Tax=Microbispora sp. KK1-11 TaxID=2053005 RepID=UPI00115BFA1D|nr:tetratricopeptide repeat protein [Microbispora sp. KK1-11]TQS25377.1 tetratricopeptide repeat protein [Microbispora sp. KK1-11]